MLSSLFYSLFLDHPLQMYLLLQSHLKGKIPFHVCIITIIFTTLAKQTSSLDQSYEACKPQTCGNGPNISYPFWLSDRQESFCGYPSFKIACKGENPVLSNSEDDYIIKDIFYSNHSFVLANAVVYHDKCPLPLHNFSLDQTPFSYSSSDHIDFSFFYNCDEEPKEYMHPYPIDCASNASHHSFAIFHKEVVEHMNYSCLSPVNLPVDVAVGFEALWQMNYTEILKMGFLLNWTAQNCSNCEKSSGRCGFKNNEFVCFCSDRPRSQTCDHDNSWNWKRKVPLGVCTAAATILIMCVVFFVCQRRNRKQYAPSSFVSRSIFSKQTSMDDMEKGSTYLGVHLFTYRELEEATNYFDSAKELGDGGFGTVYHGNVRDGRAVAVKRLYENNCKRVEQFMNEIQILARLRHQNLVLLYGCTSRHSRELLLVYEYIPNGTLAEHLHGERAKPGALPWLTRMNIAIETASALSYLHASDIIHRDVKTTNILLDNNFCVKVADFGLSRLFPTDVTHISTAPQGTPGYVDPEYNQCYQLTSKSDVYSFGVVMIELISSLPAVDITRHRHEINLSNMAINKIQNHALHELVDTCLGFESDYRIRKMIIAVAELAFRCLQSDKEVRPSMPDVLDELKRIQSKDFDKEKAEEIDISADDVVLLKSDPLPPPPDTLTLNWISSSTTPNGSG